MMVYLRKMLEPHAPKDLIDHDGGTGRRGSWTQVDRCDV